MTEYLRVGCRIVRKRGEAGTRSLSLSGQDVGILVCFFVFWAGNGMDDDNKCCPIFHYSVSKY